MDDRSAMSRSTRFFQTLGVGCAVAAVVLHVVEISAAFGKARSLAIGFGAAGLFGLLYVATTPLCRSCKMRFWTTFYRTHVCCFMEKAALKNQVIRTARFVGWFFMAAGGLAISQPRLAASYDRFGDAVEARLSSAGTLRARAELDAARARHEAAPEAAGPSRDYAYLLMRARRYQEAYDLITKARTHAPDDLDLRTLLAVVCAPLQRTDEEIEILRGILADRETDQEARHNLGMALVRKGELEAAEVELRRAVDQAVDDLVRFKKLHKITARTKDDLSATLAARLEGNKFRAGASAYQLALVAALLGKAEKEQHLKLARNLGYETGGFDRDVKRLQSKRP